MDVYGNHPYRKNNNKNFYNQNSIKNNNILTERKKHCNINNNILEFSINAFNNIIVNNLNSTVNLNILNNYNFPTVNKAQNVNSNIYINSLCDLIDYKIKTELHKTSYDQFINLYPNLEQYLKFKSASQKKEMKVIKIPQVNFMQINNYQKKDKKYSPPVTTTKLFLSNNDKIKENNYNYKKEIKDNKKLFIYRSKQSNKEQNNSEPINKSKNIFRSINTKKDNSQVNKEKIENNRYMNNRMTINQKLSNIVKNEKNRYNTNTIRSNEKLNFNKIKKFKTTKEIVERNALNNYNSDRNPHNNNVIKNKQIIHPKTPQTKNEKKFKNIKLIEDKEKNYSPYFINQAHIQNKIFNNYDNIFKILNNTHIINQENSFGSNLGTIGTNTNRETNNSSKRFLNNYYDKENNNTFNLNNDNNFNEKISPYLVKENKKEEENVTKSEDDNDNQQTFSFNNNIYH